MLRTKISLNIGRASVDLLAIWQQARKVRTPQPWSDEIAITDYYNQKITSIGCKTIYSESLLSILILMLLLANFVSTEWCKIAVKWLKPWQMGTQPRVLSKSYPMNPNITGLSNLSFGRVMSVKHLQVDWGGAVSLDKNDGRMVYCGELGVVR